LSDDDCIRQETQTIADAFRGLSEVALAIPTLAAIQRGATTGAIALEKQATDLIASNGGRNRVTLRSPSHQLDVDLAGKAHAGIPTPHTKISPRNWSAPSRYQPAYNTSARQSTVRPATQADIRLVRRFLERR
jgi:hypothetical protein